MKSRATCLWLALCCTLVLPGLCFGEVRVVDDRGDVLVLPQPAKRIISLAPNITEMLFSIGAGELIVGADEYSNYPEAAQDIPRVNNYQAANYEVILSLEPDVVIAWQSGNGDQILARLRELGLPVFVIEPRQLLDIPDALQRLGQITNNQNLAGEQSALFNQRLEYFQQRYGSQVPVTVFYQIWNEPLITLNGKHFVSDVIRLCGGRNIFADAGPLVPYVSIEAVLQADPQLIIASGSSDASPAWLKMWQKWPTLSAVKNAHVYAIPPDLMQRHSLRILDGAELLCQYIDQAR